MALSATSRHLLADCHVSHSSVDTRVFCRLAALPLNRSRARNHHLLLQQSQATSQLTAPPKTFRKHPRRFAGRICSTNASSTETTPSEQPTNDSKTTNESNRTNDSNATSGGDEKRQAGDGSVDIGKAVRSTAATFAPRSSTRQKNPAVPGSALYRVFEVQGYISIAVGGLLSYNLLFPSDEPDLWRLMGMWSVWMFAIPSLRARDCSSKEKDALNYLFILVPLINVTLPLVWKSFAAVWSADVLAFIAMYSWKVWLAPVTDGTPPKESSD